MEIHQVLKRIGILWYIAANATSSLIIQISDITNSVSLYFQSNMLEKFAIEFSGNIKPRYVSLVTIYPNNRKAGQDVQAGSLLHIFAP